MTSYINFIKKKTKGKNNQKNKYHEKTNIDCLIGTEHNLNYNLHKVRHYIYKFYFTKKSKLIGLIKKII